MIFSLFGGCGARVSLEVHQLYVIEIIRVQKTQPCPLDTGSPVRRPILINKRYKECINLYQLRAFIDVLKNE